MCSSLFNIYLKRSLLVIVDDVGGGDVVAGVGFAVVNFSMIFKVFVHLCCLDGC